MLQEVSIRNFLSFKEEEVVGPLNKVNFLAGPSGTGKTNFLKAILALRNNNIHQREIVNYFSEEDFPVAVVTATDENSRIIFGFTEDYDGNITAFNRSKDDTKELVDIINNCCMSFEIEDLSPVLREKDDFLFKNLTCSKILDENTIINYFKRMIDDSICHYEIESHNGKEKLNFILSNGSKIKFNGLSSIQKRIINFLTEVNSGRKLIIFDGIVDAVRGDFKGIIYDALKKFIEFAEDDRQIILTAISEPNFLNEKASTFSFVKDNHVTKSLESK